MTLTTLWLASQNAKKLGELRRVLEDLHTVRSLGEVPGSENFDVVEDAPDFRGNAAKKAREGAAFCRAAGVPATDYVLADDSGLCVDALDGAPGVLSARYAGPGANDQQRYEKLLRELASVTERSARFVCALCLYTVQGDLCWQDEARCEGQILEAARGIGGFGYDPVFAPSRAELAGAGILTQDRSEHPVSESSAFRHSFAELDPAIKDRIGHRGKALQKLRAYRQNAR